MLAFKSQLVRNSLCTALILFIMPATAEDGLQEAGSGAVLNVIHSERLRPIMQRLDSLTYDRERTALELQRLQMQQIEELLDAAGDLLERSTQLLEIAPDSHLTEGDQITFRAMASELYEQTLYINTQYRMGHGDEAWHAYEKLRDTCNACHRLFRSW